MEADLPSLALPLHYVCHEVPALFAPLFQHCPRKIVIVNFLNQINYDACNFVPIYDKYSRILPPPPLSMNSYHFYGMQFHCQFRNSFITLFSDTIHLQIMFVFLYSTCMSLAQNISNISYYGLCSS